MDKKQREEILEVFSEGFHEVVVPELEKINSRLGTIGEDIKDVKMTTDSLDRKFDAQQNRMDRQGKQLEKHEERIQTLETVSL